MQHFAEKIHGWFSNDDMNFYRRIVEESPSPAHFVEVGSWKGRSSAFMAVEILNSGKQIKFDCVDTWEGSEEHQEGGMFADSSVVSGTLFEEFTGNMAPVKEHYTAVRLSSFEAARLYENMSLDFVFLDAAHDFANVRQDILCWLPKVRRGGILAGHDSHHPPIIRACNQLLPGYVVENSCWYYKK